MKAAKAAGAVMSFDLNYRAKLWNISGGADRAVSVIAPHRRERRRAGWQRRGSAEGARHSRPGGARQIEARSKCVLRHDRQRDREVSEGQGCRDDAAGSALDQPSQLERGGMDRRQDVYGADVRTACATTASAAATASRPGSSTGCYRAKRRSRRSSSAGRMARCSPHSLATRRWVQSRMSGHSRRAARRESSANACVSFGDYSPNACTTTRRRLPDERCSNTYNPCQVPRANRRSTIGIES